MIRFLCVFLVAVFVLNHTHAQGFSSEIDSLIKKMDRYTAVNHTDVLYLHTDKSIYANNETIWFTSYILNVVNESLNDHSFLSVALIKEDNRKQVIQNRYLIKGGWGSGSLLLPDSIAPGNYLLVAMTNVLNQEREPIAFFTQPVTIKNVKTLTINTSLTLLDTVVNENGVVRAKIRVEYPYDEDKKRKQVSLEYNVGREASQKIVLKENEYIINIPAEKLNQPDPVLITSVKYNSDIQHLSIKLPAIKPDHINVRFFPEGGNLINGLQSRIAWEAKTSQKQPVSISGVLYEDDKAVETVSTSENGIGVFHLIPDINKKYTVKLKSNPYQKNDSTYLLPVILQDGVVLNLVKGLISDTLSLSIASAKSEKVKILIHDYKSMYFAFELDVKPEQSRIRIPLTDIPKGLATITVLDHLSRPVAERIFFAQIEQRVKAKIETSKSVYESNEKAEVNFKLTDFEGKPVEGVVSVAVVQDNRIDYEKWQDIETYLFLENDLGKLPHDGGGVRLLSQHDKLENILLVRGWRRFTWQHLMTNQLEGGSRFQLPALNLLLLKNERYLTKPISLVLTRDSTVNVYETDEEGFLELAVEDLITQEGRKVFAMVTGKNKEDYQVIAEDMVDKLQQVVAEELDIPIRGRVVVAQKSKDWDLDANEKVAVLETAVVRATRNDYSYARENACGDYVCMNRILNCRNHFGHSANKAPVTGGSYVSADGLRIIYGVCEDAAPPKLIPVFTAREFYGVEEDSLGVKGNQMVSTLLWKPVVVSDVDGTGNFSFLTSDLKGRFRIIMQGVTGNDVVVGEQYFEVK